LAQGKRKSSNISFQGGPSQLDFFDYKPQTQKEYVWSRDLTAEFHKGGVKRLTGNELQIKQAPSPIGASEP